MDGISNTKELAKTQYEKLNKLISQWIDARDKKEYKTQGQIHLQIQDHFQNMKGLISVLRSFSNDNEAKQLLSLIESQHKHFSDLEESEKQYLLSQSIPQNTTNETSNFLSSLKITSQELDNALAQQIDVLKDLEDVQTEGFQTIAGLVPRVRQINQQANELYFLIFIMIVLFIIFYLLYRLR